MTDDFSDHPRSIAELRSDRSASAADWTPRDALISLLRDIDSKKLDVTACVICFSVRLPDGGFESQHVSASPDIHVSLGLLARIAFCIQDSVVKR